MGNLILVMAGGAVGAGARHLVGRASLSLIAGLQLVRAVTA